MNPFSGIASWKVMGAGIAMPTAKKHEMPIIMHMHRQIAKGARNFRAQFIKRRRTEL